MGAAWTGDGLDLIDAGLLPLLPAGLIVAAAGMGGVVIFEAEIEDERLVHVEHHRARAVAAGERGGLVQRGAGFEDRRGAVGHRLGIGLFARDAAADGVDQDVVGLVVERCGFA